MATIRFGDEDRDERGFIRLSPPTVAEAPIDPRPPVTHPPARPSAPARPTLSPRMRYQLTMAAAALAGMLLVYASMRSSVTRSPIARVPTATVAATAAGAAAQTSAAPTPQAPETTVAAYFNYRDPETSTTITTTGMLRVEGTAGNDWRLIALSAHRPSVWVAAADVPSTLAIADPLPDLAPPPTRTPAPRPTDPPQPPCLTAGTGAQIVTVCGWGDLDAEARAKWIATYGGNPGIVTTPTPPEWSKP